MDKTKYENISRKLKKIKKIQFMQNYWKFKSKRLGEVAKKKVDEVIDPYAGLYDEVPVDIWREQAGFEHDDDEPLF